ncbi:MAG: hypothetical protein RH859_06015 [Longimicrobiales bacterium]
MSDTVSQALGNLAMIFDIIPTRNRPKLSEVQAGTPEFDYMLASIVFDMAKKNALAHMALRRFILHADPELTRRILHDMDALEALGQDYGALAEATEASMLEAVGESYEDHLRLGRMVVRWADGAPDSMD